MAASTPDFNLQFSNFKNLASKYPSNHKYTYGTAGFRTLAVTLHSVMVFKNNKNYISYLFLVACRGISIIAFITL